MSRSKTPKPCAVCGEDFFPHNSGKKLYCSSKCRGKGASMTFTGEFNPNWKGGVDTKSCEVCDREFVPHRGAPGRFCSRQCNYDWQSANLSGKNSHAYRGGPSDKGFYNSREFRQWARAVREKDGSTCQDCGTQEGRLNAHHILPYKDFPQVGLDVWNGLLLCAPCHRRWHACNDNGVNSGEALTDNAEGNPEPSHEGNLVEGASTRHRGYGHQLSMPVTMPTSAPHESDDIVRATGRPVEVGIKTPAIT